MYYIYKYVGTDICIYHLIKPCPKLQFSKHPPDTAKNDIKIAYKTKLGVA